MLSSTLSVKSNPQVLRIAIAGAGILAALLVTARPSMALLAVGLSGIAIGLFVQPTQLLAIGVVLTSFAGFWSNIGVPAPLHRVLLLGALGGLFVGIPLGSRRTFKVRWRFEHLLIALTVLWVIFSAISAGTMKTSSGQSGLFDRLGLIPYLLFVLGPLIVDTEQKRVTILRWLVIAGAYFAATALLEGIGLKSVVWPSYINDPTIGISFERARGPFVDASANGLALFFSAIAGLLLARRSRGLQRAAAIGVSALCFVSTVFTLTRSVWMGVILATTVMVLSTKRLRKYFLPGAVVGVFVVVALFAFVPGLRSSADERAGSQRSVWDRQNLNSAAIAVVEDKPLTGVGWSNFVQSAPDYLWQAADYPLSGEGIDVHNFVLRLLSEIGIVGFTLWFATFALAVVGALTRRGPPELADWRWALLGMSLIWCVVGALTPGEFAYPTFVLWLWAGITASPYLRSPRLLTNTHALLDRVLNVPTIEKIALGLGSEPQPGSTKTRRPTAPAIPRPRTLHALTGVRFFAAFYVVAYHYRATFIELIPAAKSLNGFLEGGFLSVDFFFVLSGFIIGWNYLNRMTTLSTQEYVRFLWTRLARIYPLHLVILVGLALMAFGSLTFGNTLDKDLYGVRDFIENIFLVNSWRPAPRLTWNYPAWSISAEWLAYLLFPFGAVAMRRRNPTHVAIGCAITAVVITIVRHVFEFESDIARLAATFPLGVALAAVKSQKQNTTTPMTKHSILGLLTKPWLVPIQGLALFSVASFANKGVLVFIVRDCLFILFTAWMIVTLASATTSGVVHRFLGSKPLLYLGASSYALYMVHAPVLVLFQRISPSLNLATASTPVRGLAIVGLLASVFVAAHIGHRFIEEPSRLLLTKGRSSRRNRPAPQISPRTDTLTEGPGEQ